MFIRKIYYKKDIQDKAIYSYSANGDIVDTTLEQDLIVLPPLRGRTVNDTGMLLYHTPDETIESNLSAGKWPVVSVDGVILEWLEPVVQDLEPMRGE